ncbi:MAG TPA: cytochrome P450 [Actinomycetota bacterium]|nr:cytochrome P450 [Actinomycetota bacterium]
MVTRSDTSLDDLELFDPLAPKTHADPYPIYAALRAEGPVHRTPRDAWLVLAYEPAVAILRDHDRFSVEHSKYRKQRDDAPLGPTERGLENIMLFKDPPDHTRLRTLVNKAFTPRIVERLRTRIHEIVDELLDAAADRGEMDVISDFAYPLPVRVIAEMLGVPAEDRDRFKQWSRGVAPILDPDIDAETFTSVAESGLYLAAYFDELVQKRRAEPKADLVSELIAAEDQGEKLTEEELRATLILLLVAGHETTMNLIGNGLYALLRNPEQWQRLVEDPSLSRTAIDELLRYDGPVHLTARTATSDVEIGGTRVEAGEMCVVVLGAANRDPEQFPDPDRLDVGRSPNKHLAFSAGGHFCVGATLARVEGQIAFETLVRRFPNIALASEEVRYRPTVTLRGLEALPVTFK